MNFGYSSEELFWGKKKENVLNAYMQCESNLFAILIEMHGNACVRVNRDP